MKQIAQVARTLPVRLALILASLFWAACGGYMAPIFRELHHPISAAIMGGTALGCGSVGTLLIKVGSGPDTDKENRPNATDA